MCVDTISNVMWSPRRHHASIYFKGELPSWGRAREYVELAETRSVGGIIGPRVKDVPYVGENQPQKFTTQREASVYNDVWKSADGLSWTLVTPCCRRHRTLSWLRATRRRKWGHANQACNSDSDCYGGESCSSERKTCICQMWTPREQHAVVVFGEHMYVSGVSFVHQTDSVRQLCLWRH